MSLGQSFVHAKADEIIEPGKRGCNFRVTHFPRRRLLLLAGGSASL